MYPVPKPPARHSGFSMIELMTVVAIVGILLAVAAPSFTEALRRNRLAAQNNDLLTSFSYARGEAIRRNRIVGVCALNTASDGCATDNWNRGWAVWVDTNRNAAFNAGTDEVLKVNAMDAQHTLTSTVFNVHFGPRGTRVLPATNALLTLSAAQCSTSRRNVRNLTVRATGSVAAVEAACP